MMEEKRTAKILMKELGSLEERLSGLQEYL